MVCLDEEVRDWLANNLSTLRAWEGSRLKMEGQDALPTHRRAVAWFQSPVEDTGRYLQRFRRLNRELDTYNWRAYGRKEEPNGVHPVLSIDCWSITALESLRWRLFSGVCRAAFSLLGVKPEGKKQGRNGGR